MVFVSHGSPMAALDQGPYSAALARFGQSVDPQSILVISAHWAASGGVRVSSAERPELIYDFGGFPDALYDLKYPAPGSPPMAAAACDALRAAGIVAALDPERGWDHGTWVPLRLMFPQARVPVVELSLPARALPERLFQIGKALARFSSAGTLILGSGGIVHNLRLFRGDLKDAPPAAWARDFENWVREQIERRDYSALFNYRKAAPHAALAVPTTEHFAPLFVVLGAARDGSRLVPIFEGFEYESISMFCFALA